MVHLFCCIGVDEDITNPALLYHFFDFYRRQGVDEFYIILQSNRNDRYRLDTVRDILKGYDVKEKCTWFGEYYSSRLYDYMLEAIRGMDKSAWMIVTDIDEFHDFPGPAKEFLEDCDNRGVNCVKGHILDRVAADGALISITKNMPIDRQFPFTAPVTKELAKGCTDKIAALKQPLIPGKGHHHVIKKKWRAKYHDRIIDTHHFKWDSLVLNRMKQRYDSYAGKGIGWFEEPGRVYRYLRNHNKFRPGDFSFVKANPLSWPGAEV
jgi:hypothetical protein